jgi:Xaa-Pro aminopeptidase
MTLDFAAHRQAVLDRLADDEAVLVFGAPHHLRNGDAEYRYRPDSDVFWLTGWEDPEVAVFLRPGDEPLVMFVQPRDRERETWTGRRKGPEGARAEHGADVAYAHGELLEQLPRLLQGVRVLHYGFARDAEHDALVMSSVAKAARAGRQSGLGAPVTFHHPSVLLHELRLHKSPDEVAILREAARISAEAHVAAMKATVPGKREFEVEAVLHHHFLSEGSTGAGYTPIVAGGHNATILHYITNRDELRDGELLLIDAGCEVQYYTADITRTFPVGERFTEPQRRVYEAVLAAQEAAIDTCRPGRTFQEVHEVTVRMLTAAMVELGLLEGPVDERIEDKSFKRYFMHGTSHWLGLDVHDVGAYVGGGASRTLAPGMVLTVEPGLYVPLDDESAPAVLRGIGVRIEDDVLVTDGAPEVLTAAVPKSVEELESLRTA